MSDFHIYLKFATYNTLVSALVTSAQLLWFFYLLRINKGVEKA